MHLTSVLSLAAVFGAAANAAPGSNPLNGTPNPAIAGQVPSNAGEARNSTNLMAPTPDSNSWA